MVNGPLKNEKSLRILPKSQNLTLMSLRVSDFGVSDSVSLSHMFAFLSSHYTLFRLGLGF